MMRRDLVGQQLGNYRLIQLLGQGGFAEVYLGQHRLLQTKAAIKVLHAHLSEAEIQGFQQEAKVIAGLIHPHIVRVLDFDIANGLPFLVMDYCPHGTLRQQHTKDGPLPLATVVNYVEQVAEALQYAHDRKLIHRDVKPENMLIGPNNEILLSDFGIASQAHGTSSMSAQIPVGTIPYMAPEQIQAQARVASDQYALGIVVYEWLCGERPFSGSYSEIFAKHLMTPPPSLRQKRPELPLAVEQAVFVALAKDPRQRFSSVHAFALALRQASQIEPSARGKQPVHESTLAPAPSQQELPVTQLPPSHNKAAGIAPTQPAREMQTPAVQITPPAEVGWEVQRFPSRFGERGREVSVTTPPATKKPIERRQLLLGLGALAVAGGLGALIWAVSTSHAGSPVGVAITPLDLPTDTPTLDPFGSPFIYRGHTNIVWYLAWSPDGTRIASGGGDNVQIWHATDGSNAVTINPATGDLGSSSVSWSPDSQQIVTGDGAQSGKPNVQVWKASNGQNLAGYSTSPVDVSEAVWSPDGSAIAVALAENHTVQVRSAGSGAILYTYKGHTGDVQAAAWSPNSRRIASGSNDNTVRVWDALSGANTFVYKGHSDIVLDVAWSPDGKRIASCSNDKTVQVWNAADGSNVFTFTGHTDIVKGVAWSPDGKRIASASVDKTVQVWNAVDGSNVFTFTGHTDVVEKVVWSPDGKRIVSCSDDETVQVYQAP